MRVTSFTHCSDFGTGIWPAAEVEQGGGRREEEGGGMGFGRPARVWNRFCSVMAIMWMIQECFGVVIRGLSRSVL
jgi:hypothetical protein